MNNLLSMRKAYDNGELVDGESVACFLKSLLNDYDLLLSDLRADFSFSFSSVFKLHDDLSGNNVPGVKVEPIVNDERSVSMILDGFAKYKKWNCQSAKRTYRLPGIVVASERTVDKINLINAYKKLIEDVVTDSDLIGVRKRGAFFKENVHKNVVLKELYRKIVVVEHPIKHCSFTWGNHVPQSCIVSRDSILNDITQELIEAETYCKDGLAHNLREELAIVKAIGSDAIFKKRRPVAPHPRANITLAEPVIKNAKYVDLEQKHAYLPLVLSVDNNPIGSFSLEALKDSHMERRAERTMTNKGFKLLVPRLDLYVA